MQVEAKYNIEEIRPSRGDRSGAAINKEGGCSGKETWSYVTKSNSIVTMPSD